jgi:penicillin-binding protein 2
LKGVGHENRVLFYGVCSFTSSLDSTFPACGPGGLDDFSWSWGLPYPLWQLSFWKGHYSAEAEEQLTRLVHLSPSRGVIFDRSGELLVRNIPAYNVTIIPGELPEDPERERAVLERLSRLIDVPYSSVETAEPYPLELWMVGRAQFPPFGELPSPGLIEMVDEVRYLDPFAALIVAENVDRELALLISQESGVTMPGVDVEAVEEFEAQGYNANIARIGYAGIESSAEEYLRGVPGRKYVRKDVLGQELGVVGEVIEPVSGDNVYLTLDMELQEVAVEALSEQMELVGSQRGVVIALDPRDGQILRWSCLPPTIIISSPVGFTQARGYSRRLR